MLRTRCIAVAEGLDIHNAFFKSLSLFIFDPHSYGQFLDPLSAAAIVQSELQCAYATRHPGTQAPRHYRYCGC